MIECSNVVKAYGTNKALDHLSFSIRENTITGLIGRNGAGKTTLLKIVAGFWRESSGDVRVFSKRPFDQLIVSANTVFIDDRMTFPDTMTLVEILEEAARFYENWDAEFAKRLFDYFSFRKSQMHQHLSKGKRSTFNVIIGLASRCALTIYDEPTTGMDEAARKDFYRALLRDYIDYPRTILLSSHHLHEVEDLLEDVLLIDQGKKILHTSMDELRTYAIGLTGNTAIVEQWVQDKDVLAKKRMGRDQSFVVVKNNFPLDDARRFGMEISAISPSDTCVHLTNRAKGGIDDVFDRR